MSAYIQVGVTALRDPVTGEYLPAVPLYIREEDRGKVHGPIPAEDSELGQDPGRADAGIRGRLKAAGVSI